jgi:diguanylate cyclase (GGDEF)-like protein
MILDSRSILLTSTAVSIILTIMMYIYRRNRKVYPGYIHWLLGDIIISLGFLLLALRGAVPDFLSVVVGNVLLVLSMITVYHGVTLFFGNDSYDFLNLGILILAVLACIYTLYWMDNEALLIILVSLLLTLLLFRMGILFLFKAPDGLESSTTPSGVMMILTGVFFLTRGIDAIILGETYELLSPRWINVLGYLMGAVLVASWTFGFFFLNSARLELDLKYAQEGLKIQTLTDSLTGVYNRRHFFQYAANEFQRARRYQRMFSILMIDLDKFKTVNDRFGHAAGDRALIEMARVMNQNMRKVDTLARLGGEEFVALITEADLENAMKTAERIREQAAGRVILFQDQEFSLTISIGVATLQANDTSFEGALRRADEALYRAKQNGRNRVSS